ncbi:MAG: cytochrome c [Bradymonadales bacterium]|nr:MAG: cytochrome c [Bradymonadales bacterium]
MNRTGLILVGSLVASLLLIYWVVNHSGYFPYSQNPMQYMPDMHRTPVLKPQRASPLFEDGAASRQPPAGVVARAGLTGANYPYWDVVNAEDVSAFNNPLPATREVVMRGKELYDTHCYICHGATGMGDGPVVPPYPRPPVLVSPKLYEWADSQIYHVITVGQNQMYSYAKQVREQDRWKIVHYVRVLQLAYEPSEEDLEAFEERIR